MKTQSTNRQTASFSKTKKFSIPTLSLIICGFTATSVLADTLNSQECAQLSRQYDDTLLVKQGWEMMQGNCQIGSENICTRTDYIEMQQAQEELGRELARLKNELTTTCPNYAEGL